MSSEEPESLPPVLSDDERAYRASFEKLVDWYRLRQSRVLAKAFLPALLLPVGSMIVAFSLSRVVMSDVLRPLLTVLGVLVTASGPVWVMWQLFRAIRGDLYIAIRLDGLAVRLDPTREQTLYGWERLHEIRHDPVADLLRIEIDDSPPLAISGPFEGVSLKELASRIRDARRLAVWNRLVPRYPPNQE